LTSIAYEINMDGLVGMTHTYGGMSIGNIASTTHEGEISNPRQAALQGLTKMRFLSALGIIQAVLPPHERPYLPALRAKGFKGTEAEVIQQAAKKDPLLLWQSSSSAGMWTANAATVSPRIDSSDFHVHFTPANLATFFHRSIETETTGRILQAIFPNPVFFEHHPPLPSSDLFFDEGAANHIRFCRNYQSPGVQLFVFGKMVEWRGALAPNPAKYPARQSLDASEAISKMHRLYPGHAVFAYQNPKAIDAGAFHNDIVSTGNQNLFLIHELAFWEQPKILKLLKKKVEDICDTELLIVEVKESELPLQDAIASFVFNSQIITLADGSMDLIAPSQCKQYESVQKFLKKLTDDNNNPIARVHYIDLSQSMANGGGPACLRLRVVLNEVELREMNPSVLLTNRLYDRLVEHVNRYYPIELSLQDLSNPELYQKNCESLDKLTKILNLGKVYPFQM
jgi:succinylarginine dihydrolase